MLATALILITALSFLSVFIDIIGKRITIKDASEKSCPKHFHLEPLAEVTDSELDLMTRIARSHHLFKK